MTPQSRNVPQIPALPPNRPALIGMVHAGALPGTPGCSTSVEHLAARAADEAAALADAGFDALIVENMHDAPYVHGSQDPAVTAAMTRVAFEIASRVDLPLGIQILSGGNREALAVATATTASFIRCENFVFSHIADEGLLERAEAGPLLRYRRSIDAQSVSILADIKKKHASHAITADVSITDAAHAAEFFGADALVVTGRWTGHPADLTELDAVTGATRLPVYVGSGVTKATIADTLARCSGVIVGSAIKQDGNWANPVDPQRAASLVAAARG